MNKERNIYVPEGGPPQGIIPNSQIFALMGEKAIFQMLEDFYLELGNSKIRHLFPGDLVEASKRSGAFFVYILGGPPLYQQQFGPPMMRKRHLAFSIDEEARLEWLRCFKMILKDADKKYQFPMEHMDGFCNYLDEFSKWMVNKK
ncbi:MAG: hypothetical protein H0W88_06690 [Parachlamydiaceae bacterium]|nr:hypothetical protein [Parachlamydiaceae bacterium]